MKNIITILIILFYSSISNAQINVPGKPLGQILNLGDEDIEVINIGDFNNKYLKDSLGKSGIYGFNLPTNISILNQGTIYKTYDNWLIWRIKITSSTAKGFQVLSDNYFLPKGVSLYFYKGNNFEKHKPYGAFTHINNRKDNTFSTGILPFNELIVELNFPPGTFEYTHFSINKIVYVFQNELAAHFGNSLPCP